MQIAIYSYTALKQNIVGKMYCINYGDIVYEIYKMPDPKLEMRHIYDKVAEECISVVVNREYKSVLGLPISFSDMQGNVQKVESEDARSDKEAYLVSRDRSELYKIEVSHDYPNFHSSGIFYKEIEFLPARISGNIAVTELEKILMTNEEKGLLANELIIEDFYFDTILHNLSDSAVACLRGELV